MAKLRQIAPPAAWLPADFELPDLHAIRALARGEATAEQQRRALTWIVDSAAALKDLDYRPDEREHVFMSGRQYVGRQIAKLLTIDPRLIKPVDKPKR